MLKRRDLFTALAASAITLACVSIAQQPAKLLDSTAWKWEDLPAKKTDVGELRSVVREPTRTLDELEHDCPEIEHAAQMSRLELLRLYGQQAEGFTYTLPLCRGLR